MDMEEALYLDDMYKKEFEATVESVSDGKYVVLDTTAFYPNSGGQPHDTGTLTRKDDGAEFDVIYTGKFDGRISHEVDSEGLKQGDTVHGVLDWDRRYTLMRMHTAAHVISAVFHDDLGVKITGNKKGVEKSRIDFGMEEFDRDLIREHVHKADDLLQEGLEVETFYKPREEVMNDPDLVKLADAAPPDVDPLRLVKIGDVDIQADGGTHVKNTDEVGSVEIVDMKNKGRENRRVYFTLDE